MRKQADVIPAVPAIPESGSLLQWVEQTSCYLQFEPLPLEIALEGHTFEELFERFIAEILLGFSENIVVLD